MNIWIITLILFGSFLFLLILGVPIAFVLAGVATIYGLVFIGSPSLTWAPTTALGQTTNVVMMAIPLFIFMGNVLQHSRIGDALFDTMYHWFGGLRGGLAGGVIIAGTVFAAMCGVSGAGTITMGLIALPAMLQRKYHKGLALGSVAAAGLLSLLIPPSVAAILYGSISGTSVGKLYAGMMIPGIILAFLYIVYIFVRSYLQPNIAPALPKEERLSWKKKISLTKSMIMPIILIMLVLGTIYTGACTPTEAAGVGAVGSLACALINRSYTWKNFKESVISTFKLTGMVFWLIIGAVFFSQLYTAMGARNLVTSAVTTSGLTPLGTVIVMQLSLFVLGMFMDDWAIILLCTPIFLPIIIAQGVDPLWFGVIFMININIAWLTPPYGFNLFYMRSIAPKGIAMGDIIRSVIPFIGCQILCLIIVMAFPQLATWLPSILLK